MFDPNNMNNQQQQQQIQYQTNDQKQDIVIKQDNSQSGFAYTNVNMMQQHKMQQQQQASTVNMAQLTGDDKCYIATSTAQQPFQYNYVVANNQMHLTATQNTISNITFKCDICGLMFGHLSLLNHHKRIHNTSNDQQNQSSQITVQVTSQAPQQNVQGQPTQIQIVSAERIRYACEECGTVCSVSSQSDLKGPFRCENCAGVGNNGNNDGGMHEQQGQTVQVVTAPDGTPSGTIFVVATNGPDANVKFEQVDTTPSPHVTNNQNQMGSQNTLPMGIKSEQINATTILPAKPKKMKRMMKQEPVVSEEGHHPVKRRGIASVTKCNKCNGSGIIFIGGNKRNQDDRDKPFHCNICNGSFSRYSSLWSHKRLHSGEKNFKCNICGLAFAKAAYLKNHSRIHTGEKPYRCGVCGMQFSQSPHLKNHERIHSGERPYICEVCDKSFARHSTLWNHRRIHTGEKPYRCDICGSCFNQATHLKNHAKVHSGEKPFKCDICSVGFSDRFALKRHRNIHEKYGRTKPAAPAQTNMVVVNVQDQAGQQINPDDAMALGM